jgi:hypothetical protein
VVDSNVSQNRSAPSIKRTTMKIAALSLLWLSGSASALVSSSVVRSHETRLFERRTFVTGNWKLNPQTRDEAVALAKGIADAVTPDSPCEVSLFVPFPFLEAVQEVVGDKLSVGAEVSSMTREKSWSGEKIVIWRMWIVSDLC